LPNIILLNVILLSIIVFYVNPLNVIVLDVTLHTVILLNVIAPSISLKSDWKNDYREKKHILNRGFLKILKPGNTKGGSITVPLTSCLTGLESAV